MAAPANKYLSICQDFVSFNSIQQVFYEDCIQTDKSLVISAPTGSGKTVALELAILRAIELFGNGFKAIYFAPLKALCHEKATRWTKIFSKLSINTLELTGDTELFNLNELENIQLILTTPEKWDSLTRKWRNHLNVVSTFRLVMIDEVHLLNEPRRGATLEAVISRMKFIDNYLNSMQKIRYIAISATIPNAEDIAAWLGSATKTHYFDDTQRMIPLEKHVFGFPSYNTFSIYQFDAHLTSKLEHCLREYSCGKPTLIFCNTRRSVETTAQHLAKHYVVPLLQPQMEAIWAVKDNLEAPQLMQIIRHGVAYHHAGLSFQDRSSIENLFRAGHLPILVSTNTLAMGVNLPAYLVVVKGTAIFGTREDNSTGEYSCIDILQMIGRAGRGGCDTKGVAIILTHTENVERYKNLVNGTRAIESNLAGHLIEHLNAEIVLETICNLADAINWLRTTFFYVRAIKSPRPSTDAIHENGVAVPKGAERRVDLDIFLQEECKLALVALKDANLIAMGSQQHEGIENNREFGSTAFGRLVAKHFISVDTLRLLYQINGSESLGELLDIVCHMNEFQEFKLRANDKRALNELNRGASSASAEKRKRSGSKSAAAAATSAPNATERQPPSALLRFPLGGDGKISNVPMKISCLLQAHLGNVTVNDAMLAQETAKIYSIAVRLVRCLNEYARIKVDCGEAHFRVLVNALTLMKCMNVKMWEDSPMMLIQLPKIGPVRANALVAAQICNFEQLSRTSSMEVEKILKRSPPFGDDIHNMLNRLPTYFVMMQQQQSDGIGGGSAASALPGDDDVVVVESSKRCFQQQIPHHANGSLVKVNVKQLNPNYDHNLNDEISLFIGDAQTNKLVFYQENIQKLLKATNSVDFEVAIQGHAVSTFVAHLIHHSVVGLDQKTVLTVNSPRFGQKRICDTTSTRLENIGTEEKQGREMDITISPPKKVSKVHFDIFDVHTRKTSEATLAKETTSKGIDPLIDDLEMDFEQSRISDTQNQTLLTLIEARDRWRSSSAKEVNLEEVLTQITGKSSQRSQVSSQRELFNDIVKRFDKEEEEEEKKEAQEVRLSENLTIFFEN